MLVINFWMIFCLWRPNLRDEGDNHLVELAVASGASFIITQNIQDLQSGELNFDTTKGMHPAAFLNMIREEEKNNGDDNITGH